MDSQKGSVWKLIETALLENKRFVFHLLDLFIFDPNKTWKYNFFREITLTGPAINELLKRDDGALHEQLYQLKQLNFLNLHHTELKTVSEKIEFLQELQKLALNNNQIEKVPMEIGKLTKLKLIDLSFNKIHHIPAEFKNLIHLDVLLLSHNSLKDFNGFADLKLQNLDLNENLLQEFPKVHDEISMVRLK